MRVPSPPCPSPLRLGPETPYTLLTRIGARVSSASALLVGAEGARVLRGGLVSAPCAA